MKFSGQWRDYQQEVLDGIEKHLSDDRIHIVAAPGSGKTVLGLELLNRLGRPALILSPSLTIRDQWPSRLVPLFLNKAPAAGLISQDIGNPAHLTTATYQALHAIWAEEDQTRFDNFIAWSRANAPITLVLDEAHHLRREWWRALDALIEATKGAKIIALTATPPYDAPFAEWERYEAACGPIDFEIGIPELVRNGDLCPHQDHVVFSAPSEDLLQLLERRREALSRIVVDLRADSVLADAIECHPWMREPEEHLAAILEAPETLSAMLIHLAAVGRELPSPPLELLGAKARDVPMQLERWIEVLLNAIIFGVKDSSPLEGERRQKLHDRLHRHGFIEGNRVKLGETRRIVRMMAGDRAKIASISEIAKAESHALGDDLRMVVLTDHIRASEMPSRHGAEFRPSKLGVVPIFETLRRLSLPDEHVALLSGSMVVLPNSALSALDEAARKAGIDPNELRKVPQSHCETHVRIDASGKTKQSLVALVTKLFEDGILTILVGTQALLGEGWDAPAINSLVLASNSASYMLSNQMRGRAIRIDPARSDKVSNIWHLATLERLPGNNAINRLRDTLNWGTVDEGEAITADLELLQRRFEAFAGISNDKTAQIRSGLERLDLFSHADPASANQATFERAANRQDIAEDWRVSLGKAPPRAHVRPVACPSYAPRMLAWPQTIERLGISALGTGATAMLWELTNWTGGVSTSLVLTALAGAATIATLPGLAKAGWLFLRNGSIEQSLEHVGESVLWGIRQDNLVSQRDYLAAKVLVERGSDGSRSMLFEGLPRPAEQAALEAVVEVLGPIQNPRYLLVRKTRLFGKRRTDYHAVPTRFGRRKQLAEEFAKEWRRTVGPSELVHTRTIEGRKLLLKARAKSLAAGFQRSVQRRSDWR